MRKLSFLMIGMALLAFVGCKDGKKKEGADTNPMPEQEQEMQAPEETPQEPKTVSVKIASKSDSDVTGQLTFTEEDGMVTLEGALSGLNPGKEQAIHLHEEGDCSSDDGESAGGHWNPTDEDHGKWDSEDGYHKGDIGNLEVDDDGNATIDFETDEWCIDCEDTTKNIIGKAVIVHEGADDFETQPTGDAGGRIGCGVIKE